MKLKNSLYFSREALVSLYRNRLLSIATVSTVAICILILGAALLLAINASNIMDYLESDVEIVAFLDNELTDSQISDVMKKVKDMSLTDSVKFISKEQALKNMQAKFAKEKYDLEKTLSKNPLPNSLEVKAKNPQDVAKLARQIENIGGVYKVNYGKGVVERLFKVTRWVRIISIGIIVLLAFGAVFLIATTIRLSIFSRRKEIYLMKLIGATDWFVRWPFFIEGILLGGLGSLVAILLLWLGYGSLIDNMKNAVFFLPLVYDGALLLKVYLSLLVGGAVLGVLGTYISLNRFLKV